VAIILVVAVAVLAVVWIGIRESRNDSFHLLVLQGTAFTEALAQASENAIAAEGYYDRLVQRRYTDLAGELLDADPKKLSATTLTEFARLHGLNGIYLYRSDSTLELSGTVAGERLRPPDFVERELRDLIARPDFRSLLVNDTPGSPDENTQYYVEIANELDRLIVFSSDATSYNEALRQTGIGYLAQRMAQEKGVDYIIYQSYRGIIFSSRKMNDLLAIESDPFLKAALDSDTIMSRIYDFQGTPVLELVRPFNTRQYPFGLFRVGLSLSGYYLVSRGYDRQMILLGGSLFALVTLALLYVNSRYRRREISRQYSDIKTLTDRIFEQMRVGVMAVDHLGVIRLANASFLESFGLGRVVGEPWTTPPVLRHLRLEEFLESDKDADQFEAPLTVGNTERILLVARSRVSYEDGRRTGVVVVSYDLTMYRQFEREANRRERLSEMGSLAAGVAHEIRNPLNTIAIAAQRLAAEFSPETNREEYLAFTEKIRSETRRLNDIITRFLALAREDKRRRVEANLTESVRAFATLVQAEADRLRISLELDLDPELPLAADPDALQQLLMNLYLNAKEALVGREGRIALSARREKGALRLTFGDSGPGIPPELRQKVFTPYFTTKEAGTGLGLPTVHRIVTDLNGAISVGESRLGGAEFVITLPMS